MSFHPNQVKSRIYTFLAIGILQLSGGISHCVLHAADSDKSSEAGTVQPEEIPETLSVRSGSVIIDGREVDYQSRTGTMVLKKEDGTPRASIFYTAYIAEKRRGSGARPITFSFNGGPGSASVWLHLGVLGPRRVLMDEDGFMTRPPFQLVDNEFSLLDKTDLVFIDPVSTGFSRAATEEKAGEFHGFNGDIESVAEFIRLYVTRNERWLSPKFIIGESYGTTRAAGLSTVLQEDHGMYLNGIMLVSSVLQFQTIRFGEGNDLPYILFFPSYTATAHYHGALEKGLQDRPLADVLKESEEFASRQLAPALLLGDSLKEQEMNNLIERAARLTGLSREFVADTRLRINAFDFMKELLRDRGQTVGRFDSRYTGRDRSNAGTGFEFDPSYAHILGPFTAAMNHYVRAELGVEQDIPYEILTGRVHPWNYQPFNNRYVEVAERLRRSMSFNPYLHVYVASGYMDLATPYFATDYTFRNAGFDSGQRERVHTHYYPAGHMMYLELESLRNQKDHLAGFIEQSLAETATTGE